MMPWVQALGIAITVILFFVAQSIALFKWIKSSGEWMSRMEERTSAIVGDLKKVNKSLELLATADYRISQMEKNVADHEERIRELETGHNGRTS